MERKVLLGLTTTAGSDWRGKTREIDELGIKEIALFPTFIKLEERAELYELLKNTGVEQIPHVHLSDNMEEWEIDYLVGKYRTSMLNIHANSQTMESFRESKYRDFIYIENCEDLNDDFANILDRFAGICLDVSHWEDLGNIQKRSSYEKFPELLDKYKIGCSHISAVRDVPETYTHYLSKEKIMLYSNHLLRDNHEVDYVEKYVRYLPEYVSIELENSFKEQIGIREYLDGIINKEKQNG